MAIYAAIGGGLSGCKDTTFSQYGAISFFIVSSFVRFGVAAAVLVVGSLYAIQY